MNHPRFYLSLGLILLLLGWIIPVLMVMRLIPLSFTLSFLSWIFSTGGLFLGFIGAATYVRLNKK